MVKTSGEALRVTKQAQSRQNETVYTCCCIPVALFQQRPRYGQTIRHRRTRPCSRPPSAREIVAILRLSYAARLQRRLMDKPLGGISISISIKSTKIMTNLLNATKEELWRKFQE